MGTFVGEAKDVLILIVSDIEAVFEPKIVDLIELVLRQVTGKSPGMWIGGSVVSDFDIPPFDLFHDFLRLVVLSVLVGPLLVVG